MIITDQILENLPFKRKNTPSGWTSFNAVCCHHVGQRPDDRGRGGIMRTPEGGVAYHCFNCGFTTGWQPGRRLSYKMRRFMTWLGIGDDVINRLVLFAISQQSVEIPETEPAQLPEFTSRGACPGQPVSKWINDNVLFKTHEHNLGPLVNYLESRCLLDRITELHWTPEDNLHNRVLIPFSWQSHPMGYTGRLFTSGPSKTKYLSNYPSNLVWGYDKQTPQRKFVLVVEGVIDAMHLDCIAVCGNEVNDVQSQVIESLDRDIIVVPDRDEAGKKMVSSAIKYGWSVAFPDWHDDVKDVADACVRYGRLFTMQSILKNTYHNKLKIQLHARKWF